ncbi:epithelial-stromal interaction protein 1 [Conger conger]|uniref:epithelial-stromal interaction protein 1 n=1 Tax=Conger conger TaxID=82655 RepID=UPI002A5A6BA9|nr:epithelial-stromal interaction protein 1 [Conger conger]
MDNRQNFSNRRLNSGARNMYAGQDNLDNQDNNFNSPDRQNTQPEQNERQPQYAGAYTMIPPNQSRRIKTQTMAQKEEEDLQRWREENRPGPISLAPSQLGGSTSLAEARQRQFNQSRQCKLQKKLKQEDLDRRKREEEEQKNQQMKTAQREKSDKLKEKREQEDLQRRYQHQQDRRAKMEQFLQKHESCSSAPAGPIASQPTSSWDRTREYREAQRQEENMELMRKKDEQRRKSDLREDKEKQLEEMKQREIEMDHRRVNSAFLDSIEARSGSARGAEPTPAPPEDRGVQPANQPRGPAGLANQTRGSAGPANQPRGPAGPANQPRGPAGGGLAPALADGSEGGAVQPANEPRAPAASPGGGEAPGLGDSSEDDDHDREWAVMKLINNFPYYERDFLEDILEQCDGDYQRAYTLLE